MIEIQASLFMRKPNVSPGHKVTLDNIHDVAAWCEGTIYGLETGHPYIRIPTANPGQARTRYEAQLGQWILKMGRNFAVYAEAYLIKHFIDIPNEIDLGSAVQMSTRVVAEEDEQTVVIPEQSSHHCCQHTHAPANVRPNAPAPKKFNNHPNNRG